ncbi:hypothetical protein ACHAWF_004500 [Thalassiosira exigua]
MPPGRSKSARKAASSSAASSPPSKRPRGPPSSAAATKATTCNTAAGEHLLDRLRILLQRLQSTSEILQTWPETKGDSARVHADTAAALVASIRRVATGLRSVERHVNGTGPSGAGGGEGKGGEGGAGANAALSKEALEAFRSSLESKCPVPLDLLDLLDVGQPFGLNPLCYARGLMKESMRRLAGYERRKRALDMLATAVERGMMAEEDVTAEAVSPTEGGKGVAEEHVELPTEKSVDRKPDDEKGDADEGPVKRKRDESEEVEDSKKAKTS